MSAVRRHAALGPGETFVVDARQTRPFAVPIDDELERFCALIRQAPYCIGVFDPGLTPVFLNGALSHDGGHLSAEGAVRRDGDGERLALEWIENGKERGFDRHLIEKALPFTLGARTSYELGASGLRFMIDIPLS